MKKSNKYILSALAFAAITPAIVIPMTYENPVAFAKQETETVAVAKTFKDLPKSHPYYDMISEMTNQGIISGYEDGTFKPTELINRQHAALLINNAVNLPKEVEIKPYNDIPTDYIYREAIYNLQQADLIKSDAKGNFNPRKSLTRGEMAKIIAVAYDLEVKADYTFDDVKGTEYEEYVKALYSNGVTSGYEDNTFRLNEPLTRAHYALFMYQANNLNPNFVAEPIGEATTPKGETPFFDLAVNGTPWYNPGVSLPKGETDALALHNERYEEQKRIAQERKHTHFATFTINREAIDIAFKNATSEEMLKTQSTQIGITVDELKAVINKAIQTGELYDGGKFTLFYNFRGNTVKTSYTPPLLSEEEIQKMYDEANKNPNR